MRRMFSEKQIQEISKLIAEGRIEELAVRKMKAPSSTTLTDEQIAMIKEGVFIQGTFIGVRNPILTPTYTNGNYEQGIYVSAGKIGSYAINMQTKVIARSAETGLSLELSNILKFNNKELPTYPADTGTFVLKCVDGVITWVEEA